MTKDEYAAYEQAYREGTEGLSHISSGGSGQCADCAYYGDEPRFMAAYPCSFCQSPLGGNRTPAHAITRWEADNIDPAGERMIHALICDDCVYYTEYGRLDDMTMAEIEA